jgi:hypothetical protein
MDGALVDGWAIFFFGQKIVNWFFRINFGK